MTVVVDTSVLIAQLRGDSRARQLLETSIGAGQRVTGSVMTKVEVLAGVRTGEEAATFRLLRTLEWIAVDEAIADRAGKLAQTYLRSHPGVDPIDYVVAATVERLAGELWTLNLKHFPMFPSLSRPY